MNRQAPPSRRSCWQALPLPEPDDALLMVFSVTPISRCPGSGLTGGPTLCLGHGTADPSAGRL
jgi:hypothetical protein